MLLEVETLERMGVVLVDLERDLVGWVVDVLWEWLRGFGLESARLGRVAFSERFLERVCFEASHIDLIYCSSLRILSMKYFFSFWFFFMADLYYLIFWLCSSIRTDCFCLISSQTFSCPWTFSSYFFRKTTPFWAYLPNAISYLRVSISFWRVSNLSSSFYFL